MKILPLIAAVLFATSCSKDDNGDTIADAVANNQQSAVEQPTVTKVTIPFSIKVATGNSLSKVTFAGDDGTSEHNVEFDALEDLGKKLTVVAADVDEYPDVIGELTLTKPDADYIFDGFVYANSENEPALKAGTIDLVGTFEGGETGEYFTGNFKKSTESLAKLMQSFKHTFTANFNYKSADIKLLDNVAYFCFTVSEYQKKFDLSIGSATETFDAFDAAHQVWIAVPAGVTVTGNMVKSMTTAAGKVYKVDRSKDVDFGPKFSVLWATCNLGATSPAENGNYYACGETTTKSSYDNDDTYTASGLDSDLDNKHDAAYNYEYELGKKLGDKGYRMPTKAEFDVLLEASNCVKDWKTETDEYGVAGYEFTNDYGTIFLPAAGCRTATNLTGSGVTGYYWTSVCYEASRFRNLYFNGSSAQMTISQGYKGYSVRPIRSLN